MKSFQQICHWKNHEWRKSLFFGNMLPATLHVFMKGCHSANVWVMKTAKKLAEISCYIVHLVRCCQFRQQCSSQMLTSAWGPEILTSFSHWMCLVFVCYYLVVVALQSKVWQANICTQEGQWWPQGGAMNLVRQLLPNQLDGANWGPLDHASYGPQLAPFNCFFCACNRLFHILFSGLLMIYKQKS